MTDDGEPFEFQHPRKLLRELGISPRKSFSQNFLAQPGLARRIAELAWWPPETEVLEIGGGTGVLTDAIARRYSNLVVVELDRALAGHLEERYRNSSVRVIEADVRGLDIETLRRPPIGIFGNLPYAITTELLMSLIHIGPSLAGAVVMVQREYAERLGAGVGTKAYGSLTIFAAFRLRIRDRFRVGPGSFYPPPQVDSSVLALEFIEPPSEVNPGFLERVVRAGFRHRRKYLASNLASELELDPERVNDALLGVVGSTRVRAEELSPDAFLRLAGRLVGSD